MKYLTALFLSFFLFFIPLSYANESHYNDNFVYDMSIRKWSHVYNPTIPWYWWKMQIKAESDFKADARSPVGAQGLAQIMPGTWVELERKMAVKGSPFDSSLNIQLGAAYMKQLRSNFKKDRPEYDRHSLAMASYNAGIGHIIKAQKLANNSLCWNPTQEQLHLVTGRHSKETRDYVARIWRFVDTAEKTNRRYYNAINTYESMDKCN